MKLRPGFWVLMGALGFCLEVLLSQLHGSPMPTWLMVLSAFSVGVFLSELSHEREARRRKGHLEAIDDALR